MAVFYKARIWEQGVLTSTDESTFQLPGNAAPGGYRTFFPPVPDAANMTVMFLDRATFDWEVMAATFHNSGGAGEVTRISTIDTNTNGGGFVWNGRNCDITVEVPPPISDNGQVMAAAVPALDGTGLGVTLGGTGASDAATARTNLGAAALNGDLAQPFSGSAFTVAAPFASGAQTLAAIGQFDVASGYQSSSTGDSTFTMYLDVSNASPANILVIVSANTSSPGDTVHVASVTAYGSSGAVNQTLVQATGATTTNAYSSGSVTTSLDGDGPFSFQIDFQTDAQPGVNYAYTASACAIIVPV